MCVFLFMSLSLCVHVPSRTVVRPSLMLRHRHPTLFQLYQETLPAQRADHRLRLLAALCSESQPFPHSGGLRADSNSFAFPMQPV